LAKKAGLSRDKGRPQLLASKGLATKVSRNSQIGPLDRRFAVKSSGKAARPCPENRFLLKSIFLKTAPERFHFFTLRPRAPHGLDTAANPAF
jgi:hypothetical protein